MKCNIINPKKSVNNHNKEEIKIFGTDGIRGKANCFPMTPEMALLVGKAVAHVFMEQNNDKKRHKIIIGKDTRLSGYMIESALQAGIVSMGTDVFLVGPMPTPAIAQLTRSMNADAGIVISASHNPADDNGIKIFGPDGYKLPDAIENRIEKLVLGPEINCEHIQGNKIGKAHRVDEAYGRYIEFTKSSIGSRSLNGMKIVVDCANGAAYSIAPKVFSELGAEVIVLNNEPNGLNINKGCGATHPELISKAVKKYKADVGIALDGDADRIIMCDEKGNTFCGDKIIATLAVEMKRQGTLKKNSVVITVMSNLGLKKYLKKNEISFKETKVGDRYVIECMRKNDIVLGGEQSGHIILSNYVTTGDAIIVGLQMLKILKERKKKLSEIGGNITMYPQELVNIQVKEKKDIEKLKSRKIIRQVSRELGDDGRVLVRYSGTENLCRVMVEAKKDSIAKKAVRKIADAIKKEIGK